MAERIPPKLPQYDAYSGPLFSIMFQYCELFLNAQFSHIQYILCKYNLNTKCSMRFTFLIRNYNAMNVIRSSPFEYRSIWISDIHLGTPGRQADMLLDFLKHTESDYLYLIGDVIDGWRMKRSWYWRQAHNDVIQKILRKARKGTRGIYIPGNHDEIFRDFCNRRFGRVAIEKNVEAFLALDLEGTKYVVGDGPAFSELRRKYPAVRFVGMKTGEELACHYAAADVFVFPSRTDTFGLVIIEARASGVPVAAYPIPGPLDVIGDSGAGVLSEDLGLATRQALNIAPDVCRRRALESSWERSVGQFLENARPAA